MVFDQARQFAGYIVETRKLVPKVSHGHVDKRARAPGMESHPNYVSRTGRLNDNGSSHLPDNHNWRLSLPSPLICSPEVIAKIEHQLHPAVWQNWLHLAGCGLYA